MSYTNWMSYDPDGGIYYDVHYLDIITMKPFCDSYSDKEKAKRELTKAWCEFVTWYEEETNLNPEDLRFYKDRFYATESRTLMGIKRRS